MNAAVRVFLVDDHTLVRSGLRLLLEQERDIVVVGESDNADDALRRVVALAPDVVLMDISLPDHDGLWVTRQLCDLLPQLRVIALTMHSEDSYLLKFLEIGGVGYVRKSAADRDLIRAIQTVMKGDIFLHPEGVQLMARRHHAALLQPACEDVSPDALSEREREVIVWVAKGYTCREIGDQLALSPRTVETYRVRIMEKLNLAHRSELVEYALRHRLLGT